jgi:hypothetical protein
MKKIKKNAIAKQKVIIAELRENSSSESSREIEIAKLNLMVDDYENDNNVIDEDNIHLYYEFMSDEDFLEIDINIFVNLFNDRIRIVSNSLFPNVTKSFFLMDLIKKHAKQEFKCLNKQKNGCQTIETLLITRSSLFEVIDTLKPIVEYIADIKNHEAYKSYIAKVS